MTHHNKKRPPKTTGITEEEKLEIYREYYKGESVSSLAKKHGYSYASIYRFINEEKKRIASIRFHQNRPMY